MDRILLQDLADRYAADAWTLPSNGRHETAYYVCGYAVECALKACVAKKVREHAFPDLEVVGQSDCRPESRSLILYTETLVKERFEAGRWIAERLRRDANVIAAFWFYDEDAARWRLIFISPDVDTDGPGRLYALLRHILTYMQDEPTLSGVDIPRDSISILTRIAACMTA